VPGSTPSWPEVRRQIDQSVTVLFAMVVQSLRGGTSALLAEDRERAGQLIAEDRRVDQHCEDLAGLIRQHLTSARDSAQLETLIGVLQLVPELERSADLGEHIAQRALSGLGSALNPRTRGVIQSMSDLGVRMWEAAADAYLERSRDAGFDLAEADDELDRLARELVIDATASGADPGQAAEMALVARFYERLGDHAVNVARRVDAMLAPRRGAHTTGLPFRRHRFASTWLSGLLARIRRLRVTQSDADFFDLFRAAAVNALSCSEELRKMVNNLDDLDSHYAEVRRFERTGDQITIELQRKLDSSFVTPYDREDIHILAEKLDDVVDDMFAVAELMHLVQVGPPPSEFPNLADVLVAMSEEMVEVIDCLQSRSGERYRLEKIESLEREGDAVYRRLIARLFSGEYEALEVLKWKDIVQALENALNTIEDVSGVVETILVKDS
jgi:uncharacterized protein